MAVDYRDYYKVLGVDRGASQADVKRAFRKLARQHHPDLKPGDASAERRFKEINEANAVLSDPEKRKLYDELGANWEAYQASGGAAGADPFGPDSPYAGFGRSDGGNVRYEYRTSADSGEFSDFFRTFFEGAATGTRPRTGGRGSRTAAGGASFDDILAGMGLGGTTGTADGFGSSPGGRRQTRSPARTPSVEAEVEVTLEEAFHGTKRLISVDGKRLEVTVPRGVETGSRIRLKGRGGGDPDHPADLYLVIRVKPHPVYTRIGADLTREVPITLGEALLGAEVTVKTLKGRVRLKIPEGTQPGRTFRLKGQGMPRLKPKPGEPATGDLLVRVKVILPTNLSKEARAAAQRLVELVDQPDPRQGLD
ncbi:MAG: curved DNA-binding protein [Chloroflexota bacterium]|nr:curved DNA-binding protein [Chloroflexota bacterium]